MQVQCAVIQGTAADCIYQSLHVGIPMSWQLRLLLVARLMAFNA
jgi:hypothetical protein